MEARRVRELVVRLDDGDELPGALVRALDEMEAKSGWVQGSGVLASAEIAVFDVEQRRWAPVRRIATPCAIVSLGGSVAALDGATSVRLTATLARETDRGLELIGGELVSARVVSVEIEVRAFDDLPLVRVPDARTGLFALERAGGALAQAPSAAHVAAEPAPARPQSLDIAEAREPEPIAVAPDLHARDLQRPPLPARPVRPQDDVEVYPEPGDRVNHFHFGECDVVSSDGERIRLRQQRDGRIREVALTMLKIAPPTVDDTGARHFTLARKH